jgi:hypothetical protein
MIPLAVEFNRELKHIGGAELNAKTAAFAEFGINGDLPSRPLRPFYFRHRDNPPRTANLPALSRGWQYNKSVFRFSFSVAHNGERKKILVW